MSNLIEGELTHSIVGSFFTVYNYFGFGLIEAAYCGALELELKDRGYDVAREVTVPIAYHGRSVAWQRLDLVVDNKIIVEAKAGEILLLVFTDGQANVPWKTKLNLDRLERQRQIELEIAQLGKALKKSGVITVVISTHDRFRSNDAAESIAAKLGARCSRHFVDPS